MRGPSVPSTPSSATVQTLFGGTPAATAVVRDPSDVLGNTIFFSKEFVRKYFLIWYWAAYILLKFIGFDFLVSLFAAMVCLTIGCLTFGLVRAVDEALKAKKAKLNAKWQQQPAFRSASVSFAAEFAGPWNPQVNLHRQ